MKIKKIPMRTCVVTNEKFPKGELLRIVRTVDNEVKVDTIGKMNGHGVYIKKDLDILDKAIKSKVLERRLECPINEEIYVEIRNIISK